MQKGWQDAEYVALYIPKATSIDSNIDNGITYYGEVNNEEFVKNTLGDEYIKFSVVKWPSLKETIRPVGYGIQRYSLTTLNTLKYAKEIPELFIKTESELKIWRMLRRLCARVHVDLDNYVLDAAKSVDRFYFGNTEVLIVQNDEELFYPICL